MVETCNQFSLFNFYTKNLKYNAIIHDECYLKADVETPAVRQWQQTESTSQLLKYLNSNSTDPKSGSGDTMSRSREDICQDIGTAVQPVSNNKLALISWDPHTFQNVSFEIHTVYN